MPDVCADPPQAVDDGNAKRCTPMQVPGLGPQLPGVAAAGSSVAIVFDHPSVHHGRPPESTTIMCGVPLFGWTIGYSEIAFPSVVSSTATWSRLAVFSVNQIFPRLAAMPYGCESALGVWKSR